MLIYCIIGAGLIVLGIAFVVSNCSTIDEDAIDRYLKQRNGGRHDIG